MNTDPSIEVPTAMREMADQGITQARQALDSFLSAAQRTAEAVANSADQTREGGHDLHAHSLKTAEQNVRAALDFAQQLIHVTNPQEVAQLQAQFLQSQLAAFQAQAAEFGVIAQSAMGAKTNKS